MASIGETRVRTEFNPSKSGAVEEIKQKSAALINLMSEMPKPEDAAKRAEFGRLVSLAMTAYEEAAMWAVKAATTPA